MTVSTHTPFEGHERDTRLLAYALRYHCEDDAGLAEGTDPATIKTANAVDYVNAGVWKNKGATDNIAIPAGTTVPISSFCKFLVCLAADGTPSITQGNIASTAAAALLPEIPAGETPIGYFQIATNASATYVPGTTDNGAAGITDTYVDQNFPDSGHHGIDVTTIGR